MKKSVFYFFPVFFMIFFSSKAQKNNKNPEHLIVPQNNQKSNYICDSLFTLYTSNWLNWWTQTLKIKGGIPGKVAPAHFIIPYNDLLLLDSLGRKGQVPDSVEAFFAFTSKDNYMTNQITAILSVNTDTASFRTYTDRWKKWSENHIKGEQPVGFKIRYADLDSMFRLLDNRANPVKYMTGYFAFHLPKDKGLNRMAIIFRPTFKGVQTRVSNNKISCGKLNNYKNGKNVNATSFINIDFTNPCPPCNDSD